MRTCIVCEKPIAPHSDFTAQNGKSIGWQFAHTHCLEESVLKPRRIMLDYIKDLGDKFRRKPCGKNQK